MKVLLQNKIFILVRWNRVLFFVLGMIFIISGLLKSINVYSFSQTINSFCGLWGLNIQPNYSIIMAIIVCTIEFLLPFLSISPKYRGFVIWCYPMVLGFFTYITYINYTDLYGGIESCGCFGEIIHLSPGAAFYKNIVLFALSLLLLILYLKKHIRVWKPISKIDNYIFIATFASVVPPLFSYVFMNRMSHESYLLIYLILCLGCIFLCPQYIKLQDIIK